MKLSISKPEKLVEEYGMSPVLGIKSSGAGSVVSNKLNYAG